MARPESIAVGGFYETPPSCVPLVARHLRPQSQPEYPESVPDYRRKEIEYTVVDACAGAGAAVMGLIGETFSDLSNVQLYACEMEATRHKTLSERRAVGGKSISWGNFHAKHGDSFRLSFEFTGGYSGKDGAGLLYLNCPYDHETIHKRLEEKWLVRFAQCLMAGGILAFVVPHYALSASANTIGREFTQVQCYRFPDPDYEVFRQVVLFGVKRPSLRDPDPAVVSLVQQWAESTDGMPILGSSDSPYTIPGSENAGFAEWRIAPLDVSGLLSHLRPWHYSERAGSQLRPIAGCVPGDGDLLTRKYPVAMPPKPAHIAAGIAAGVFNGARVESKTRGLPALYVKGVFTKDFVTVDEKSNKDGDKTAEIQVQQPKLVVTALDLSSGTYHTLKQSGDLTNSKRIADFTTADLLEHYGPGLMATMLANCPVLHDAGNPEHQIELPEFPRKLYRAQASAVMAAVKLLGGIKATKRARRGAAAFVLGEIGSGKSFVSLAVAKTISARRVLVMCPPHLLQGWTDQVKFACPEARVQVLESVADVDSFAACKDEGMVVAVLSRETAKLGHSWAGVGPTLKDHACRPKAVCPKCGHACPSYEKKDQQGELARTRARCQFKTYRPGNRATRVARELALALLPAAPTNPDVRQVLVSRVESRMALREVRDGAWDRAKGRLVGVAWGIAGLVVRKQSEHSTKALTGVLVALGIPEVTEGIARRLYQASCWDEDTYGHGAKVRAAVRNLLTMMPVAWADRLADELKALGVNDRTYGYGGHDAWASWRDSRDSLSDKTGWASVEWSKTEAGEVLWNKVKIGSLEAALIAQQSINQLARFTVTEVCGEPLYQAIPEPRRYPLATYLTRKYPALLDLFIGDEGHEFASGDSAQSFAAHRFTGLGIPTLLLTGSIMNGYAESLFTNQWALDSNFREEFSRTQRAEFIRRYGYLKQLVEDKDKDSGKVVAFGSQSDRVERTARTIGSAPGVLPLFVLRYLLRQAVTIHKADLALDLPKCREIVEFVEPTQEQMGQYGRLLSALKLQIKQDRFRPEYAGKLWGQMAEIPSYLDRTTRDTGNVEDGRYVVAYPESCESRVVAEAPGFGSDQTMPKEQWMLDTVERELSEGRRVMVFAWHACMLPRLQRLISERIGEPCPLLDAGKVQAAKRQAWIDKEVIGKGRRTLVVNPVAVQTGLNNLVWFASEVWMQNPACNPIAYRQAVGRVDRIGQKMETRIYFPVYAGTAQVQLHRLLMHKVGVSLATDGLDAGSALAAAGVGTQGEFDGFAVGKVLFDLLERGETERPIQRPMLTASAAPRKQLTFGF